MKAIGKSFLQFSYHKFASRVIEKCLEHGSPDEREFIIGYMFGEYGKLNYKSSSSKATIRDMMRDPYANYAIQKVLEVTNIS